MPRMGCLVKIEKKSAEGLALESLRAAIMAGTLPPGARLTEMALAEQLGTSRATVRTALHHLVGEGLAVQVPYTGWMVTSLSADDAWELVTLRASFESLAASLAAERGTPDAHAAITASFEALQTAARSRRSAAATAADFAFHRAIVVASGHERLAEHFRRVAQQISILIASSNALIANPQLLVAQHQPLYDAIMARKATRAGDLARRHIEDEGAKLLAHLRSIENIANLQSPTKPIPIKPTRKTRGTS
jgi:DNA-binding GntR family transcriptional regulator